MELQGCTMFLLIAEQHNVLVDLHKVHLVTPFAIFLLQILTEGSLVHSSNCLRSCTGQFNFFDAHRKCPVLQLA
uniref:Uncharacterized protein n=1 Tax=Aegilops tauschii subsp. strangulata TaxID=200361 RepID=A0A453CA72_AEGTS